MLFLKLKSDANDFMVDAGDVRAAYLLESDRADTAADIGRLRQTESVTHACGASLKVRRWYHKIPDFHKFMVATSRIVVNHDGLGGSAFDAMTLG